jgi:hypothetical protein
VHFDGSYITSHQIGASLMGPHLSLVSARRPLRLSAKPHQQTLHAPKSSWLPNPKMSAANRSCGLWPRSFELSRSSSLRGQLAPGSDQGKRASSSRRRRPLVGLCERRCLQYRDRSGPAELRSDTAIPFRIATAEARAPARYFGTGFRESFFWHRLSRPRIPPQGLSASRSDWATVTSSK